MADKDKILKTIEETIKELREIKEILNYENQTERPIERKEN